MATLDVFEPDIAVQIVGGCPSVTIERAVLNAAIDFCLRTHAWQLALDSASVDASDFPYEIPTPTDAELHRVLTVIAGDVALQPVAADSLDAEGVWREIEGPPRVWLMEDQDNLIIHPLPSVSVDLLVRASFKPSRTAISIPDFLASDHYETIQSGALSRLLMMPKREWTDINLGAVHAQKFTDECERIKSAISRSLSRSTRRVKTCFV